MQANQLHKVVRPLVKWTGGKYEEFPRFAAYIPTFARYFEPFFGGGGVFFAMQPLPQSFINDKSTDLIAFYESLSDENFKKQLFDLVDAWEAIRPLYQDFAKYIIDDFDNFLLGQLEREQLFTTIGQYFDKLNHKLLRPICIFSPLNDDKLRSFLQNGVRDKTQRIKRIVDREQRIFDKKSLNDHIETALRSAFYMYIRSLMNKAKHIGLTSQQQIATWYFVRELCYASMFRFNAKGEFNIPYGGMAYNKKNLRAKVKALFREEVQQIFENCKMYNLDFADFLDTVKPTGKDFIFLDPPYDSEFSEYDQNAFTQQDQLRLRDCLRAQSARWMMVIKETGFIRKIYEEIGANFIDFDKTYMYNVRGRNNRETKHLIITNYSI